MAGKAARAQRSLPAADEGPVLRTVNHPSEIPDFKSETDEAEFWATHELGPGMLPGFDRLPLRLDEIDRIAAIAERRDTGWGNLIRSWILERLAEEERAG